MDHTKNIRSWEVSEPFVSNELGIDEEQAALKAINQKQLTLGPQTSLFEKEFAKSVGAKYAVAVNSCTSALYLASQIINLSAKDEVIITPQTLWVTAWPALSKNAKIHFADIDANSLCCDPKCVLPLINTKTKAIFVTHFGGYPVDIDPIIDAAKSVGAYIVEDCAHANGASYKGRSIGNLGDISCFSFGQSKNMTTGEGGMFVTNNPDFYYAAEHLRRYVAVGKKRMHEPIKFGKFHRPKNYNDWHAQDSYTNSYCSSIMLGQNYRMSEITAAIGRVQLQKLQLNNAKRRKVAERLDLNLSKIAGVEIQKTNNDYSHAHHLYTFFIKQPSRSNLRDKLINWLQEKENIEITLRYFPIHLLPEFRANGHRHGECPVAEETYFNRQIQLPIYPNQTMEEIDYLSNAIERGLLNIMPDESII